MGRSVHGRIRKVVFVNVIGILGQKPHFTLLVSVSSYLSSKAKKTFVVFGHFST